MERASLVDEIDTQVFQWSKLAVAHNHPSLQHQPLAERIIADCTTSSTSPEDVVSTLRFTGRLTEETPADQLEKEQRRYDVSRLAQHIETDTLAISNPWFSTAFETAESYLTQYQTSPPYEAALHYLKRLYTIREQASPLNITRHYSNDTDTFSSFASVLRKLIEDL